MCGETEKQVLRSAESAHHVFAAYCSSDERKDSLAVDDDEKKVNEKMWRKKRIAERIFFILNCVRRARHRQLNGNKLNDWLICIAHIFFNCI
jgi:hypothetical protein